MRMPVLRFWPTSLSGQFALLVALALLVAQGINFGLLVRERDQLVLSQISAPAIARLADAIERDRAGLAIERVRGPRQLRRNVFIAAADPVHADMRARSDVARRARGALDELGISYLKVEAAESDTRPAPPPGRPERMDRIRGAVDGGRGGGRAHLLIAAQIAPDRWVSATARLPSTDPRFLGWLLVQTLILYGVVLVPVLWLGRRMARPLQALTVAVETFRSAETSTPVTESGPGDVRRLIAAFNGMRTRIATLLNEKDRMLGAIGHDLRTPLASLRVRVEGMEDEDERERMVGTIEEMNRTLDDILSLARLGRPNEAATKVDLAALLDQVVDDFQMLGAPVTLEDADRTTVTIRPTLITRALRNLIDNAVKYGGAARVNIAAQDGGIAVVIDDDGPGIPEDRIEAMFEPFARMEESRSRETGGTGLGLALARAIVIEHGGRLTLANRPGGGFRATMWLVG